MGVWRQTSAYRILQSRIPCSMPYKKHTTHFTSCPHLAWPHYVLGKALTIAASKWMCSQAKAPMSSASLHHRFHPLYLLKIGQGNPSRAYLRGNKKLAEKTYRHPIPSLCSLFSDFIFILAIFTHSLIVFLAYSLCLISFPSSLSFYFVVVEF